MCDCSINERRFHKYHALGNDYLVLDPATAGVALTPERIRLLCHRHCGIGSDGILWGPLPADGADFRGAEEECPAGLSRFALGIYNPDGSEAEKSGNGLRIFARYLLDTARVGDAPFTVLTLGGPVRCEILEAGAQVRVEMGQVSFCSDDIPVAGPAREVLNEEIQVAGQSLCYCAASIGNPHCVLLRDPVSAAEVKQLGPLLETDARFPNRTNVQFMKVESRTAIQIEIWERGAGYTLASGSSASAAAAVARRLGFCDAAITVRMPGGDLQVTVDDDYQVTLTGPVTPVAHGTIAPELLE